MWKFDKQFDRGLSDYFDGWERYGVKEDDGKISTIYHDEIPSVSLVLTADDQMYIGPAEDVREYYKLFADLKKEDLVHHQDNGKWRPGRLVIEDGSGTYQVWVSYKDKLSAEQLGKGDGSWARADETSRVIYCDGKRREKVPTTHKMSPVFDKLANYFGDYELGVFKEAEGEKDGAVWTVKPGHENIGYLKAMNAQGKHIFIRPTFETEPHFMLHDDVNREGLAKYHQDPNGHWKPGRFVIESSPGNYQVWIKSDRSLAVEEKKHWLSKMDSDPGASPRHRWGRCPGFRNRKEKYKTDQGYPLARFEWIDWKNTATIPNAEITQEPRHTTTLPPALPLTKCAGDMPTRDRYYKGVDEKGKVRHSEQDFAYMLALIRRGMDDETIKSRIRAERTDWGNHKGPKRMEHYLTESLQKARSIIGSKNYRIDIYAAEKKTKLKSVRVGGIPAGQDHQAYLSRHAKDIVVKEGYEPNGIMVDIQQVRSNMDVAKTKAFDNSGEKVMSLR
jgi:hypothetical protein